MHIFKSASWIDSLLTDDCPGPDLTVEMLGIGPQSGAMRFSPREDGIISGVEEAEQLLTRCGLSVTRMADNGNVLQAGQVFLDARGRAAALHKGWKAAQVLMEYMSGIARRCAFMLERTRAVRPGVQVAVTRKTFPGAKALCLEAALNGGAIIHRQNLSESVLLFAQHLLFFPGSENLSALEALARQTRDLRARMPEKNIAIEVDCLDDALLAAGAGLDIIQCEKFSCQDLAATVGALKSARPDILILAAGGINGDNAAEYAATGVDVLVTSWPYWGRPADIQVVMEADVR